MGSHRADLVGRAASSICHRPGEAALNLFLAWLVWLPDSADIATEARAEIERIDQSTAINGTVIDLRNLLDTLARSHASH